MVGSSSSSLARGNRCTDFMALVRPCSAPVLWSFQSEHCSGSVHPGKAHNGAVVVDWTVVVYYPHHHNHYYREKSRGREKRTMSGGCCCLGVIMKISSNDENVGNIFLRVVNEEVTYAAAIWALWMPLFRGLLREALILHKCRFLHSVNQRHSVSTKTPKVIFLQDTPEKSCFKW